MNKVIFNLLQNKDYIVKNYVITVAKELNLTLNDTLLLIYLSNQDNPTLDIDNIVLNMHMTSSEVLESFQKLKTLNLLSVEIKKSYNGSIEEIIKLDNILEMISCNITESSKEETKTNLYDTFEKEFGRLLSPMEYEIINDWLKQGFKEELIEEALKEAIYNNAKSFRYISAILNAWKDKGYRTVNDIVRNNKKESLEETKELFDYDWLNSDE